MCVCERMYGKIVYGVCAFLNDAKTLYVQICTALMCVCERMYGKFVYGVCAFLNDAKTLYAQMRVLVRRVRVFVQPSLFEL